MTNAQTVFSGARRRIDTQLERLYLFRYHKVGDLKTSIQITQPISSIILIRIHKSGRHFKKDGESITKRIFPVCDRFLHVDLAFRNRKTPAADVSAVEKLHIARSIKLS